MSTDLEARVRDALDRVAATTDVTHRPFDPTALAARSARVQRSWSARPALAAAVVVCGLVAIGLALTGDDPARQVTAGPTDPTAPAAPLLGPLPYIGVAAGGPVTVRSVDASRFTEVSTLDEGPWWVQAYRGASPDGPVLRVLSPPELDHPLADVEATYAASVTAGVEVQGSPARLLDEGDGIVGLWWPSAGRNGVLLTGRGLDAAQLQAVADGLAPRADGLGWKLTVVPDGLSEWVDAARAPSTGGFWNLQLDLVSATGQASLTVGTTNEVAIAERAADQRGAIEPIEVLGRPGILVTGAPNAEVGVYWQMSPTVTAELWITNHDIEDLGPADDQIQRQTALDMIAALRELTEAEWLAALPANALTPTDVAALLAELGPGTPLPGGAQLSAFEPATSSGEDIITRRVSWLLSAASHAGCRWSTDWLTATDAGDAARADAAITALEGAASWSVIEALQAALPDSPQPVTFEWEVDLMRTGDPEALRRYLADGPCTTTGGG